MFASTGKQIRLPKIEIPHAPRLKTSVRVDFDMGRVEKAVAVGDAKARSKAGQAVRRQARSLIRKNRRPSVPGKPPHTRRGRLRQSILYSAPATEPEVIIGPAAHIISRTGHYHEFGGMQIRRFPRKKYAIGKPGPIRENPNYTVEAQRYLRYKSRAFNTKVKSPQKAIFTRIRTPKQLANNTIAVIVIVLLTTLIVFALDLTFEAINEHGIERIKETINVDNETTENVVSEESEENSTSEQNSEENVTQNETSNNETNTEQQAENTSNE